jgi:hypothetical protein
MLTRWFHVSGMFAVLLALMAQLGMSISAPSIDPVAGVTALCHIDDDTGGTPSPTSPSHSTDCLVCPLCGTLHVQLATLVADTAVPKPPAIPVSNRSSWLPPSTAPPALHRPPNQPRAPPIFS